MIILRSIIYNVFFFGMTLVLTLIGTVVRLVAPHRMLDVAVAWGRLLLWGARGTGKSSLVKAAAAAEASRSPAIKLVELDRDHLSALPALFERLGGRA